MHVFKRGSRLGWRKRHATPGGQKIAILTPVKDAVQYLPGYRARLSRLTYPHKLLSLGFLEGDSTDATYETLRAMSREMRGEFRRVGLWKRDFGYSIPAGIHRGADNIQVERRRVPARSRNHLLFHALDDENWVLWLDVDVMAYPPDIIERLLSTGGVSRYLARRSEP
jgi:cellulose synthase/poly-beta-1,6-N-acetylglucosamine synthase-like glycosyltransferase